MNLYSNVAIILFKYTLNFRGFRTLIQFVVKEQNKNQEKFVVEQLNKIL